VPGMNGLRKNPRHCIGIADGFPQGLKPESFYGLHRLDSSHPSDEDLSLHLSDEDPSPCPEGAHPSRWGPREVEP
jgi:hypothetical protein